MRRRRWLVALLAACMPVCAMAAAAEDAAKAESAAKALAGGVDVVAGFEGLARVGAWTPVAVRLRPAPADQPQAPDAMPRVYVWAEDADGEFVRSPPARWVAGSEGEGVAATTVRLGRPDGRLRIDVEAAGDVETPGDGPAVSHEVRVSSLVPSWQRVVLVLGDVPGIERACRLLEQEGGTKPRPVGVKRADELGRSPLDFDAADAIVVCGSAVVGDHRAPDDVLSAIDGWVRRGGHLLLLAGPAAGPIATSEGVAGRWLPGSFDKLVPLRRTAALETFARSSRPLEAAAGSPLLVPKFSDLDEASDAVIDVFEGAAPSDLPLVVRRAHGFGTVVWAAFEPDLPPLRSWTGTDTLLTQLLEGCLGPPAKTRDGTLAGRTGTADLADQLRRAIDTFPDVAPVPFEWIALLAGLYVVTLYPAGWWAVNRIGRLTGRHRAGRESAAFAWLLLPGSVVAFTLVASQLSHWRHPRVWRQSRCDVIDLDAAAGGVRAVSFAGTWSPVNAVLDRSVRPRLGIVDAADPAAEVSWFAPAGAGLGATDAASPHPSLAAADYGFGRSLDLLEDVPIASSSSRLFEAGWHAQASSLGPGTAGRLDRDAQGTLRGSLVSRLPFPLEACVLAHAGWLYDVGTFTSETTFDPAAGRGPRSLAGSLTRRSSDRERDRAIRYDPLARDAARILEIAGLHAAAGGSGYTSLEGGRLARLDLSSLLSANRAILIGTGPAATAWLDGTSEEVAASDGNRDRAVSVWRIVIPIGQDIGGAGAETKP